uniref:Cyclic nucleotide-binding domain-containing protein n=1 Tax=Globisporangium ultimum (strain ATCC 200006 / CBS 805.95 / DAOM BR144) TaxID=431595 RepID=K3XBA0_GLOUD
MRRVSSRCIVKQQEVPAHLLKFLHKTPEQQQRLNAVKLILADEPSARNEMSLDIVYDWMLQNCKQYSNNIFGSAPEYIRREICRQMRLLKVMSHGVIIRQGDSGDRCYIVINGIVDVYIKKESDLIPADPLEERSTKPPLLSRRSQRGSVEPAVIASSVKDFGGMVANLGPGAMFGEIVLLNPTAKRNATIIASQYTECSELICLERADYIRLVRTASMEASHYNHAEILDQMHLFQGWDKHVGSMRSMNFISNEYLYRAGSDAKWMFVITSGEVMERINWAIASSNSSASTINDPMLPRQFLTPRHGGSGPNKKTPEKKVNVELALIGPGDIAGEVPFVTAKWKARFDIKAVTDVQTLAIERRFYETTMMSATFESNKAMCTTMQLLKKIASEREDWRQQRLECGTTYPNAHISISTATQHDYH